MKIIYFDYWTKGIHNFVNIDKELKKLGHQTSLFHIGSFRESVQRQELLENIECFDISCFDTNIIYKALVKIKPDVIVTLNTTYLLDRALIQACKRLNIKTVFLMHGTRATGDNLQKAVVAAEGSYNSIWKKFDKSLKYFKLIIPNYVYSLYMTEKRKVCNMHFLKVIYSYFKNPGKSMYFPAYSDELLHDKCLVYAKNYIEYYNSLGYKKENIFVVGNPKQDNLFYKLKMNSFKKEDIPEELHCLIANEKKYAVYLEDSFPESGNMFGWDNEFRNKHLTDISKKLEKDNIVLVVKLHPATNINDINITSLNAIILEKAELDTLVFFSAFCIAHISTTVNIPILMGKPILIPKWDKSEYVIDYYTDTNVANKWLKSEDCIDLTVNKDARKIFINQFISIVEPVAMQNIVKEIVN